MPICPFSIVSALEGSFYVIVKTDSETDELSAALVNIHNISFPAR